MVATIKSGRIGDVECWVMVRGWKDRVRCLFELVRLMQNRWDGVVVRIGSGRELACWLAAVKVEMRSSSLVGWVVNSSGFELLR